ncbi:MAG: hypothetical protein LBU84_06390 [Prevotella sp.]|jgi:hypothetical protein|nr:hypothetical protein [Prevotella sp.]
MADQLTTKDKQALLDWDQLVKEIQSETIIEHELSPVERDKKLKELEADPVEWMYYFFPKTTKYPFAPFQIEFINRIVNNPEWYEVLSWARELAKTSIVRLVILYLILTGKKKNIIIASATEDSAIRLLRPYRAQLTANQRLIYFYGEQKGIIWKEHEFATKNNVIFRAVGYGNEPRGSQFDDTRPDVLLPDDFDTDSDCRNEEILNNKWSWWETALYFTRSWSEPLLTIWCGNIIAKDCCIVRAGKKASELAKRDKPLGNWDIINIRMVDVNNPNPKEDYLHGTSVWDKNSEEQIDIVLSQVSSSSGQKECFNNPVTEGTIFKEIRWGTIPDLKKFRFLIAYGDPAPSNTVKKKSKKASYKAVFLIGIYEGKLYVITGFLDRVHNDEFINWFYVIGKYVSDKTQVNNYIENNKLQDPFFQQVFKPTLNRLKKLYNKILSIVPDGRDKPDKAVRIEGNLEQLNRDGYIIFNIEEKGNPHMLRLEEQFKMFDMQLSYPADGPDCIEGGYWVANEKMSQLGVDSMLMGERQNNSKRI